MFLKAQLLKLLKNVDTNLQHKNISIQLATPRSIATFHLGYLLYIRFIEHEVRKQIAVQTTSISSYIDLYMKSQQYCVFIDNILPVFGMISSSWAYLQSKNIYWAIGGGLCFGMLGCEYFLFDPLRNKLMREYDDTSILSQKKEMQRTRNRFDLIRNLAKYLNGKIVLSALAIVAFYVAQFKHSQQVDVKLSLKK